MHRHLIAALAAPTLAVLALSVAPAALAAGAAPTDPQIAHIAYTAGVVDIEAARQAVEKAGNKEVAAFARDMIRDHEAVNKQALDLVKKLNVTPEDNATSQTSSETNAKLACSAARTQPKRRAARCSR